MPEIFRVGNLVITPDSVLVDQDSTIADTNARLQQLCQERFPELKLLPFEQHTNFYFEEHYPEPWKGKIHELFLEKGFFLDLPLLPGAKEALKELLTLGKNPFICTKPFHGAEYCEEEKRAWSEINLGREWLDRIVIVPDKTVVPGKLLIDDQPEIGGKQTPSWEHVLYDQPYNRHITGKRRLNWQNWRQVLGI